MFLQDNSIAASLYGIQTASCVEEYGGSWGKCKTGTGVDCIGPWKASGKTLLFSDEMMIGLTNGGTLTLQRKVSEVWWAVCIDDVHWPPASSEGFGLGLHFLAWSVATGFGGYYEHSETHWNIGAASETISVRIIGFWSLNLARRQCISSQVHPVWHMEETAQSTHSAVTDTVARFHCNWKYLSLVLKNKVKISFLNQHQRRSTAWVAGSVK